MVLEYKCCTSVWKSKKYEDIEETYYDINDSFFAHRPILEGFVDRKYISFPRNMISAEVYGNGSVYLATPGSERSVLLVNSEDKWDILKPSFFDALFDLISFVADKNNFFMKIYHYQNISLPINYQQQSTLPSFISYSLPELLIPNKKSFVYELLHDIYYWADSVEDSDISDFKDEYEVLDNLKDKRDRYSSS